MTTLQTLRSEVEKRQNEVIVGMKLYYTDACNFMSWIVTDVFEGGFEAKDKDGFIEDLYFDELQMGWKIK